MAVDTRKTYNYETKKQPVEGAGGTIDGHLLPAVNDVGFPTLGHFTLDIALLFL